MRIELCHPADLPEKALNFLEDAIRRTPSGSVTIESVLEDAASGKGCIYLVKDPEIKGAVYFEIIPLVMNIVLVGGEDIHAWRDRFSDFCKQVLRQNDIKHLCVLGRTGWGSIFKELTPLGTLYMYEDEGG